MDYLYRIYCETEEKWVKSWSDSVPSVCPNNPEHTIKLDSITIIERRGSEEVISISVIAASKDSSYFESKANNWTTASTFVLKPSISDIYLKSIVDVSKDNTFGKLRLQDISNNQTLAEISFSNTNKEIFNTNYFTTTDNEVMVEIQIKRDSGGGSARLYFFSLER